MRLRGAISPTNRTGRTAIHTPEAASCRYTPEPLRAEPILTICGPPAARAVGPFCCPARNASTGFAKGALFGLASNRARDTTATVAIASKIHVFLCRVEVMSYLTLCHRCGWIVDWGPLVEWLECGEDGWGFLPHLIPAADEMWGTQNQWPPPAPAPPVRNLNVSNTMGAATRVTRPMMWKQSMKARNCVCAWSWW